MKALVPVLVVFGWAGLGAALRNLFVGRTVAERSAAELVVDVLAGAVALHLYLNLLTLLGIPWSRLLLGIPLGAGAALFLAPLMNRRRWRLARLRAPGWGDLAAVFAVLIVAVLAVKLAIVSSDFIYHWGAKGQKFFHARAIDYEYLARPWNWTVNPNYPTMLPEVYAASAVIAGGFGMRSALLWSAVWLGLLLLAARSLLQKSGSSLVSQLTMATVAMMLATLLVGLRLAGGADLLIALALLAALPFYLHDDVRTGDWMIGICAAFAAASKLEGIVLGGLLVSARVGWHLHKRSVNGRVLLRAALPPLIVIAHWSIQCLRFGLRSGHTFSFDYLDMDRVPAVLAALWQALGSERTYGLCFLVLLLPLLIWAKRTRFIAILMLAQLLVYAAFYLAAPDPARYALASFPRLVVHLLPAVVVSTALLIPNRRLQGT